MTFWAFPGMKKEERFVWFELETGRTLIFDRNAGRFVVSDKNGESSAFLIATESFTGLIEELRKIFGTAAPVILQKAGYGAGKMSAKHTILSNDIPNAVKTIFNSVSRWGFGRYELVEFDPENKYVRFKLHDCVFSISRDVHGYSDSMNYLTGFYSGYFSALFKREVYCKQIKSLSLSDKYYEFEVKPEVISLDTGIMNLTGAK